MNRRQEQICRIIEDQKIATQEELCIALEAAGFPTTQATVSRDIRALRLQKEPAPDGGQRYVFPASGMRKTLLADMVRLVDYAGNTVVLKCHIGMAQAACAALDAMQLKHVVGTLAGDDTIFVLVRDAESAKRLASELTALIWGR